MSLRELLYPVDRRQAGILADRYLDVLLGDPRGLFVLLVQAPLIAILVAGVWSNIDGDSLTLYFVLSLSAFFLGAVNGAREIVKERALFLRERMFNLSTGAYVVSKYRLQAALVVLQCGILAGVVRAYVPLRVNVFGVGLTLILAGLAGASVGLLISAWAKSADRAVMTVPLVVIPQILFSDFVLGKGQLSNWTGALQDAMPVHWAYRLLEELRASEPDAAVIAGAVLVLVGVVYLGFRVTIAILARAEY